MTYRIKNDLLPLVALAVPLILTGIIQSSLGFFETIFLSRLGEDVMAAGSLVNWLFGVLIALLFGVFSAINILIAHKHGAKDKSGIILVLRDGLLLALALTIPAFILFWHTASILSLLGQSPQLTALANLYLHALAWGVFPKFVIIVLFELIIGLGHSRTLMIINLISIPVYLFTSFALIFGKFGLPALGIAGAGWGMTISDWMQTAVLLLYLFHSEAYKDYIRAIFTFKKPSFLLEIIHLGIPIGVMYCIEVGFFLAMILILGTFSIQALAANQITMQYLGPLMGIIFSIAQAITVRMGHQLGAKEQLAAKYTAYTGMGLSVGSMIVAAFFYWTVPYALISVDFDIHNPIYAETVRLATQFLFAAAFFQIIESARIALFGSLRALKDTRFTLFTSIIGFWIIPFPLGYLFAIHLNFGGVGLWWGMIAGATVSVLLLIYRFEMKIKTPWGQA